MPLIAEYDRAVLAQGIKTITLLAWSKYLPTLPHRSSTSRGNGQKTFWACSRSGLGSSARNRLRAELRKRPEITKHLAVDTVNQLAKGELLALAGKNSELT